MELVLDGFGVNFSKTKCLFGAPIGSGGSGTLVSLSNLLDVGLGIDIHVLYITIQYVMHVYSKYTYDQLHNYPFII